MLSLIVAYRSFGRFRQASTRLDTPPFSHRHHPVSAIALLDSPTNAGRLRGDGDDQEGAGSKHWRQRHQGPGRVHRRTVPGGILRRRLILSQIARRPPSNFATEPAAGGGVSADLQAALGVAIPARDGDRLPNGGGIVQHVATSPRNIGARRSTRRPRSRAGTCGFKTEDFSCSRPSTRPTTSRTAERRAETYLRVEGAERGSDCKV